MLLHATELFHYRIHATDGNIGHVRDLLIDDALWTVRYVMVDTGRWLPGRRVLLAPASIQSVDVEERTLTVGLSRQQVEESPPVSADQPVSRQEELALSRHYGWPLYEVAETGTIPVGAVGVPVGTFPFGFGDEAEDDPEITKGDPHLRSAREVRGYHIGARDGEIGHVDDFVVDANTWTIEAMVVDTRNWRPGKKIALKTSEIDSVTWAERKVSVRKSRDEIESGAADIEETLEKAFHA